MLKAKLIAIFIGVLFLFSTTAFASLAGSLDNPFDGDGKLTLLEGQSATFADIAVQPDGKIVAVGYAFNTNLDFLIVRFNADGTLDTTFDGDGKFDTAVFRPSSNTWFIQGSTAGTAIITFGATGDQPLPAAFVP